MNKQVSKLHTGIVLPSSIPLRGLRQAWRNTLRILPECFQLTSKKKKHVASSMYSTVIYPQKKESPVISCEGRGRILTCRKRKEKRLLYIQYYLSNSSREGGREGSSGSTRWQGISRVAFDSMVLWSE